MRRFQRLLVGVDLSQGDQFVSQELPPPTVAAVQRALWLAKLNSAHLTFFYSLDVTARAQQMIEDSGNELNVMAEAEKALHGLVRQATDQGVAADVKVQFGKSWLQIIRRAISGNYDLVLAGTRHLGAFHGGLIGSTGIKLLRKCPCPVWITQPQRTLDINSVLVAHCLRDVGDNAMELGCSLAELYDAQLHVLHSLEHPELDRVFSARISSAQMAEYRSKAEQQITSQLTRYSFDHAPDVQVVTDPPEFAILDSLERHEIELVVMGTVARSGIAGLITGNTAERLLPRLNCSILAVKPQSFVSPVAN